MKKDNKTEREGQVRAAQVVVPTYPSDVPLPTEGIIMPVAQAKAIASAVKLTFQVDEQEATIMRQVDIDFVDDGPAEAVHIWDRISRRPIFAAGNANGDIPMLQYTDMNAQILPVFTGQPRRC